MKKLILLAACAACIPAYAFPTYEPFTEYNSSIVSGSVFYATTNGINMTPTQTSPPAVASGSVANAVDLSTGGFTASSGETWTAMLFSSTNGGAAVTGISAPNICHGLDVYVISNTSIFTYANVASLLPVGFPGAPAVSGQAITNLVENPAQPLVLSNSAGPTVAANYLLGNSAVLNFSQDFTRSATATKTLFVSYLFELANNNGQLGSGNDGRYLNFVAQSNLVEGASTAGFYQTYAAMFDTTGVGTSPRFLTHAVLQDVANSTFYMGTCDNSTGKWFPSSPEVASFATPVFVVAEFIMVPTAASSSGIKDSNVMWVNPSLGSFGGATPPAIPAGEYITVTNTMNDVGGLVLESRIGHNGLGGINTNYIGNLMLGNTWSYVTGGPEFTTQLASAVDILSPGANLTLGPVAAVAAGQPVTYQWQRNGANVNNGPNGAGGSATVSGATSASLTLSGVSSGDAGTYAALAIAGASGGTGFTLASSNVSVIVSDPAIITSPVSTTGNAGGSASFTASAETTTSQLSYAWYDGSTMLTNGLQADGSTATGAQGTNGAGTSVLTLTLANISCADAGSYTLSVTNLTGSTASTVAEVLTVTDPYITTQQATAEALAGGSATIAVQAAGTGLTYQWYSNNVQLADGPNQNLDGSSFTGSLTSTLTISGATTGEQGSYSVVVSGTCGAPVTSANTIFYIDTTPTALTLSPATWTQQIGTHAAFVGTVTGGSGLIHLLLQHNSTYENVGLQPNNLTTIYGPGSTLTGPGQGALVISNIQLTDTGTYTVYASNAAGMVSAQSTLTVVPIGSLTLSTNNLEVIRVGDGAQTLSGATGNTLYLDQIETNGAYVNSIMVPDSGTAAVIVAGAAIATGNEGAQEGYLTVSSNQQYLNFGGFCYSYPYTAGSDVTAGAAGNVRGIYALNASGILALVYTNYGLYSGGHGFRDVFSTDGLTNFWTTGSASGGTVKYVNAGPAGASYTITTPGSGIPALGNANSGGVCLGLAGGNLVFSDNSTDGDATFTPIPWGLDAFTGTPMATTTASTEILPGDVAHADDFAFSPDLQTLYLADDDTNYTVNSTGSGPFGGIQRWDYVGGQWSFSYNLQDTTGTVRDSFGNPTNGIRGLCVVWPSSISSWGYGVGGAVVYATTAETSGNRIIQFVDSSFDFNGADIGEAPSSTPSVLVATAPPNEFYRGIRFGPNPAPLGVTAPPSQAAVVGQSVELNSSESGVFSYFFPNAAGTAYNLISVPPTTFQWYTNGHAVVGATNLSLDFPTVQTSNAGTYTMVMTTGSTTITSAPPTVVSVSPFTATSDLVAWYKLNDGSGATAVDSSSYGNTASVLNLAPDPWVLGLNGMDAIYFTNYNGNTNGVVEAPDAPQNNFTNNVGFTLMAWVLSASNTQTNGASLITKGWGGGGEQYDLDLFGGDLRFFVRSASGTVTPINSTFALPLGQWIHVAATFDGGAGKLALYVNDQLIGSASNAPGSLLYSTTNLSIGNRCPGTNDFGFPFQGEIQDVRLYDAPLGVGDIGTIYNILANETSPASQISAPSFTGTPGAGQFQVTVSGGLPNTAFRLWSSTNIALTPVTSTWTLVQSGILNSSGTAVVTDSAANNAAEYYVITQP